MKEIYKWVTLLLGFALLSVAWLEVVRDHEHWVIFEHPLYEFDFAWTPPKDPNWFQRWWWRDCWDTKHPTTYGKEWPR